MAGKAFAYGVPIAYNRGDEPAAIDRIALRDPSPGLRVVETVIAGWSWSS